MSQQEIEDKLEDSILRTGLVTGGVGIVVGGVASLLSITTDVVVFTNWSIAVLAPIIPGTISGLAGIIGVYLSRWLANIGVENYWRRKVVTFFVVVTSVGLIFIFILFKTGLYEEFRFALWGIGSGYVFGAVVMVVDYRLWKMRKKVLTLELENKYLSEIAEKESLLEEKTRNLIVSQERNRLARELHDSVSQGIQGIIYAVYSLQEELDESERTEDIVNHLETTARTTLDELRTMIEELKPSLLEEKGLIEAVKLHCNLFAERQQIEVNLELEEIGKLNPRQELAIYRIVQESLGNVQKYADADKVDLCLKQRKEDIKLIIEDDGIGFVTEEIEAGNGLENMKQRCRENNGQLEIKSKPGVGTRIEALFILNS